MSRPHDVGNRRDVARSLVDQRVADIDVVEEHVRGSRKAVVDDAVADPDLQPADIRLDAPYQVQVLAEDGRLLNDALGVEHAAVAFPCLAIGSQPGRNEADTTVQGMADSRPAGIVVAVGRHFLRTQYVVEAAGHEQA